MTSIRKFLGVACIVFASCTTKPPLRNTLRPLPPMQLEDLETRQDVTDDEGGKGCADMLLRPRSIERFLDGNGKEFDLGVIELSDDGHVTDDMQEDAVLARLREVALGGIGKDIDPTRSPGAIVVTFVHGWHHRAKVCDNNFACFRRVLRALSMAQGKNGRPVFGVYIGWRGDSLRKASFLSFYERKSTAHLIGHEGGREILLKLDATYRDLNRTIKNGNNHAVTMVTAGHSFGGALVYSAIQGALVRELRSVHGVGKPATLCGAQMVRPIRPGIGDLVILVNPAFEASRYRYFASDLATSGHYSARQLPVLLTVASEGDTAVKRWFPLGRILYFSVFPWRFRAMSDIVGAGHYDPQTTHTLVLADNSGNIIHPPPARPSTPVYADAAKIASCNLGEGDLATCECEYAVPDLTAALRSGPHESLISQSSGVVTTSPNENASLRVRIPWDPHTPFIVVRAAREIISEHSDIYTPRFVTFLTAYISAFLKRSEHVGFGAADQNTPCSDETATGP